VKVGMKLKRKLSQEDFLSLLSFSLRVSQLIVGVHFNLI